MEKDLKQSRCKGSPSLDCSPCCGEPIRVAGSDEGTHWHECSACGNSCDPVSVQKLGIVWAAKRGPNTALGSTKMDAIRGILDQANSSIEPTKGSDNL
jgi:hypothetical protein